MFNSALWGQIAQSVEQRTENPRVGGSIPPLATSKIKDLQHFLLLPQKTLREICGTFAWRATKSVLF
jgi:hypothetical protein